ncbi:MAG: DUF2993 domain-containing protein [Micrococcales bacterium]|nr:DUF2993 domain-containing protein [Micrococcales bacterium]
MRQWGQAGSATTVWIVVIVVLAVLGGAAFACDQYLRHQAEQQVATQVAATFRGMDDPAVKIHGFLFLPQMLSGRLSHVTGITDHVTFDGMTAADVKVEARDVTMSPARAGSATVSATVDLQTAESLMRTRSGISDLVLRTEGDRLVVSTTVQRQTVEMAGVVTTDIDAVRLDIQSVTIAGHSASVDQLPSSLRSRVDRLSVPVAGLPNGVTLDSAEVVPGGLRFTATGTDVPLTRSFAGR